MLNNAELESVSHASPMGCVICSSVFQFCRSSLKEISRLEIRYHQQSLLGVDSCRPAVFYHFKMNENLEQSGGGALGEIDDWFAGGGGGGGGRRAEYATVQKLPSRRFPGDRRSC